MDARLVALIKIKFNGKETSYNHHMKTIACVLLVMLSACASRRPLPYSYTVISHYGYDNPYHARLSMGAVPQSASSPMIRPFVDTLR